MQDCDVLWTKNPVEDFRSDPEVHLKPRAVNPEPLNPRS
jgi:hypothetical protein